MKTLIKNAIIINENTLFQGDLLIEGKRIAQIDSHITPKGNYEVIEAEGKYLIPGVIDDQVHFREPGLTHKATIATESRAAVAGGVTTFFEQPNTVPQTVTIVLVLAGVVTVPAVAVDVGVLHMALQRVQNV